MRWVKTSAMSLSVYAPLLNSARNVPCHSCVETSLRVSGAWRMKLSNCNSRTDGISGLTLNVRSPYVSFESVLSMNPTSGLKFGPILRRSTIPSSQFERYDKEAPTSLAPLGSPGDRVPAMWASTNQSLKKTRRVSTPPVWLKLSSTFPDLLSMPITPIYEPAHRD